MDAIKEVPITVLNAHHLSMNIPNFRVIQNYVLTHVLIPIGKTENNAIRVRPLVRLVLIANMILVAHVLIQMLQVAAKANASVVMDGMIQMKLQQASIASPEMMLD